MKHLFLCKGHFQFLGFSTFVLEIYKMKLNRKCVSLCLLNFMLHVAALVQGIISLHFVIVAKTLRSRGAFVGLCDDLI